ncbi:unnamed protein product [Rotaria sp. Silwood1]|nr:unnamed protein product [Rotaria sp. Silwood1]
MNRKTGFQLGATASTQLISESPINTYSEKETNQRLAELDGNIYLTSKPDIIELRIGDSPVTYEQRVVIQYLQPPALPPPGPIIIEEVRPPQPPPPPPIVIRQHPPRASTPPPLILRELPPKPPLHGCSEKYIRELSPIPIPPRSVRIEVLPRLPEKPPDKLNKNSNNEEDKLETIDFIESEIRAFSPKITWKHLWTLNETQNALLNSPFINMPTEMILKIFGLLSVPDLENVSLVCRHFKMIVDQDTIWKTRCNISKKLNSKSYKQIYIDWIFEKYLRNEELERLKKKYRNLKTSCGLKYSPSRYLVRSKSNDSFYPIFRFDQHPNSSLDMTIQLSVNIDKTAHVLILLLEKTSKLQQKWRKSLILQQMIRRYYRFMQLKVLYPKKLLIPTIDIEIVWQTHLLRPLIYQNDCRRLFHQIIDHSLLLNHTQQSFKEEAFLDTLHLYEKHFHEPYCSLPLYKNDKMSSPKYMRPHFDTFQCLIPNYSFWDETYFQFSSYPLNDYENPFSFTEADIILDGNWINSCKTFMNIICSKMYINFWSFNPLKPIDLKSSAMKRLKKSYERFLYITAKYSLIKQYDLIHPTYAIDIIWHCHMQEPLKYANDCHRLAGCLIDHHPWPSIDESHIKQSCQNLNQYWKKEFQNDISIDHFGYD